LLAIASTGGTQSEPPNKGEACPGHRYGDALPEGAIAGWGRCDSAWFLFGRRRLRSKSKRVDIGRRFPGYVFGKRPPAADSKCHSIDIPPRSPFPPTAPSSLPGGVLSICLDEGNAQLK